MIRLIPVEIKSASDSPEMEIVAHLFKLHAERTEMMGRSFSLQA